MRHNLSAALAPYSPGGLSRGPVLLERVLVGERVHAMPKPVVMVGHELAVGGQTLQRLLLERCFVAVDVLEDFGFEHEKAAVDDDAVFQGLLAEALDPDLAGVKAERAEAPPLPYGRDRRQRLVSAMEGNELADIDVGDA